MEKERQLLEELILSGAPYELIVEQSQKLDKYIVMHYTEEIN